MVPFLGLFACASYLSTSCLANLLLSTGVWPSDEYADASSYLRLRSPSLSHITDEIDEGGEAIDAEVVDGAATDATAVRRPNAATDAVDDDDDDEFRLVVASCERSTTSADWC